MNLSAIVITKNEERVIGRCLASLAFCDEIILVDSGSTDRTLAIAAEHGAVVMNEDWRGPATQRNRGLARAQGRWCLLLDADEWVPPPLRDEIVALLAADRAAPRSEAAFRIPRSSSYCGQFMRHGGWWPDPVTRLLRRGAAEFGGGIVHEHPVVRGAVGTLTQPLMHESFRDLEQVLGKVNAYSTWGAQTLREQGKSPGLVSAVAHGLWTFLRTYVVKAGFLDGRRGFMLAVSNAEGAYYKYVKAMLMTQEQRKS
jgi:glycosyltransferase involved in cell wall biosynthesis